MIPLIEWDYYIPPDAIINSDGSIADFSQVYQFDDHTDKFLKSFTGWGMPDIDYITQRGPFQHGQTALDYRLQPRIIQLAHRRNNECREGYWNGRADLLNYMRPNRQAANSFAPGRLRKILPNNAVRDIFVMFDNGLKFNARNISEWDEWTIDEGIRFIAHDPIVFDPSLNTANWVLESTDNLIFYEAVNWPNKLVFEGNALNSGGIWFGGTSIGDSLDITYNGTWLSYPTITITGPLDLPEIYNSTTNESIILSYNIAFGEVVTIDLDYGVKTVTNNLGANLIGTITTDSDIATFHIAPDPEAPNGINTLTVFGNNALAGTTEVEISYYERYIGI